MIKSQSEFRNKYLLRKNTGEPDRGTTLAQSIPKAPIYHYWFNRDQPGPEPTDLIVNAIRSNSDDVAIAVEHIVTLVNEPKDTMFNKKLSISDKLIRDYHKRQRQFMRVFDLDATLRKNTPLMVNYQLLPELYPIRQRNPDTFRWVEQQWWKSIWDTVGNIKSERMQFISIFTPRVLKPVDYYQQLLRSKRITELRKIRNREDIVLLDLFAYYSGYSEDTIMGLHIPTLYPSLFMSSEQLAKARNPTANEPQIVIAIRDDINVIYVDLRQLVEWKEKSTASNDIRMEWLYNVFASHVDKRIVIENNLDEVYHEEITRIRDEAKVDKPKELISSITDAVLDEADKLLAAGAISEGEYRGNVKLASRYESLTDPLSGEPLTKTILEAETANIAAPESTVPDMEVVEDKSYLSNKVSLIDKTYITKQLDKDIINTIMQLPREGVIITNLKMENKKDVANDDIVLILQTKPVKGDIATSRIVYPRIRPDGTFLSGGVTYRMNKQRGEEPILKIAPDAVSLGSAMGKMFVRTGFMEVDNVLNWTISSINVLTESGDITDARRGNVAVIDINLPIPVSYSNMSYRFKEFTTKGIHFMWDYKERANNFKLDAAALKKVEKHGVVCGKRGSDWVVVSDNNLFYQVHEGSAKPLGTLEEVLGIDTSKKPVEWAGAKIKGKMVPVGCLLAYWMGIDAFFKYIGVHVTEYEPNVRIPSSDGIIVKFKDCKIHIEYDSNLQELMLAGFKYFKVGLKAVNYEDLNKTSQWHSIFTTRGLGNSHIREFTRIRRMWIDPITKKLLIRQGEPTNIKALMVRACELLTTKQYVPESDGGVRVNKGYDRINDIIYRELVKGVRDLNAGNTTAKRTFSINPKAVRMAIITDDGVSPIASTNPFQVTGEQDRITFSGANGRSNRTLVAKHRKFDEKDIGVISEGFTDNGKAGTILYYTNNPNIDSIYGTLDVNGNKELGNIVSAAALLSPFSMNDD